MDHQVLDPPLAAYLDRLVPPRPPRMAQMEAHAASIAFPIIGPACGQLCYQLARMIAASRIFELGSGFGYSTAWFARAVVEAGGGVVHHTVWDEQLSQQAREHLRALELDAVVRFHVAEAIGVLSRTDGPFDLIFNDIDKTAYPDALAVIARKLRPGGIMIVDNVLWDGKVLDDDDTDVNTQAIRRLTEMVTTDPAWSASIVPIRDGVLVARKN